jgi:hypothetical protein
MTRRATPMIEASPGHHPVSARGAWETGHSRVTANRGHPGVSRRVEPSLVTAAGFGHHGHMPDLDDSFKRRDVRDQLGFWLQREVKNLQNLQGVRGRLSGWDQRRLEVLEEMKQRFDYGDERRPFSKLDFMAQQDLKRRFPGHFDDDPPRWP